MSENWHKNLPKFDDELEDVQPIAIRSQGDKYIAIIQWDGVGEFQHCVLVPREKIDEVIDQLKELKG